MPAYLFTEAAERDLEAIVDYTRNEWGDVQARRYLEQLRQCLDHIAGEPGRYRLDNSFSQPVRVLRCQRH